MAFLYSHAETSQHPVVGKHDGYRFASRGETVIQEQASSTVDTGF
jgi:hypothetical protein